MVPGLFSVIFSVIFTTSALGILVYIFSLSNEHILISSLISIDIGLWLGHMGINEHGISPKTGILTLDDGHI
jgi:hypothetical protein